MCIVPMYGSSVDCLREPTLMETPWFWAVVIIALLWLMFWKGVALWHAARRKEAAWFIILLLVNTLSILELIYIFGFAKVKSRDLFK